MKLSSHHVAGFSGLGATVLVLAGTWAFALTRPEYSHIRHTISELGESGSPWSSLVSFGLFLPTGVLVWVAILFAYPFYARDRSTSLGFCAFASLGLGYVMAAFFPCDPGSPLMGSWQQQGSAFHVELGRCERSHSASYRSDYVRVADVGKPLLDLQVSSA